MTFFKNLVERLYNYSLEKQPTSNYQKKMQKIIN